MYLFEKDGSSLKIGNAKISLTLKNVESAQQAMADNKGLSEEFFCATVTSDGCTNEYNVWQDLAVIEMPMHQGVFEHELKGNNYVLRTVSFAAVTDYHDTFVNESTLYMFAKKIKKTEGNIFFIDDPLTKNTVMLISTAPDCAKATLEVHDEKLYFDACGYGIVFGISKTAEAEALCRAWYRKKCKPSTLYTMANTWGDGNAFNRVKDDFIKNEIDAAAELGIDTLQIDDGWQTGSTADKSLRDERGRRFFKGNFWDLDTNRFKNGMEEMRDYAKEKGVKLGLWFAPDSQNCYERLLRDVSVLENAYKNWGMNYFKLDMLFVDDMAMYKKFESMLESIYSFGKNVFVQLDVTNGVRCGYLGVTQYGRLFAENRYTKSQNAYPHRAMRNLWNTCKYVPAFKFQFELVNPTLNVDAYDACDVLAPINYDMDYLFAAVMMSNPLFWMEVQFLPKEQCEQLAKIMPVWKEIRDELAFADVRPVGNRPDGASFTGFAAYAKDGKKAYLLAFREVTEETSYTFTLEKEIKSAKLLASNTTVLFNGQENKIDISFGKMRSYALIEVEI